MATVHIKEERNLKKFTVIDLFAGCGVILKWKK